MAKKKLLEAGQTVWLETLGPFNRISSGNLEEMIVHSANKTSAYIWRTSDGPEPETSTRYKVNQRTHHTNYPIPTGYYYKLWLSQEERAAEEEHKQKMSDVRSFLNSHIASECTYEELLAIKEFIEGGN